MLPLAGPTRSLNPLSINAADMKFLLRFAACALTILVVSAGAALAWDRSDQASAATTTDPR
ncbi:MAG: hypothetical protein ABI702_13385 [Burkholderiales bacterium]